MKARNTSNLVQVQRTVTRNGSTFTQNYWVNPSAVRSSDIVIGNKAVLDAYLKAQKANANAASQASSAFDIGTFDSLKSTSRDKALDYLRHCGITWKDNPNPAINWMRACMAAKSAANATSPQVVNGSSVSVSGVDIPKAMGMLSKADQDTVLSFTTGKARVAAIKSALGRSKTFEFARMAGVTWEENANAGINNMRMSMALAAAMDGYSSDSSSPQATKKVGAKPKSQPKKKKPKADPSAIRITKSMSPHKAAIAKILNDTSDKSVLQMYARTGIVAEDDTAKSFIENTLLPQYESLLQRKPWMDKDKSGSSPSVPKYQKNVTDVINSSLSLPGIRREDKEIVLSYGVTETTVDNIGTPSMVVSSDINSSKSIGSAIESIYNAFSTYATDDYDGSAYDRYYTNLGYTGTDSSKRKAQFDPKKDGFLRYLDHLEEQQPSLQPRINEMRTKYVNLLDECNYDPTLIKDMLNLSYVPTKDTSALYEDLEQSQHNYYGVTYHRITDPQYIEDSWGWDAQYRKKVIDDNVDVILNNLRDRGITGKAAFHTLVSSGSYGSRIYEYDENGNIVRTKNGSISIFDTDDFVDKNGKKIADHNYKLSTAESLGNTPLYYTSFAIVKLLNTELSDNDKKELAKKGVIPRYIGKYEKQYNTLASHIGITQDKVDKVTLDVIDMLNLRVRDKDGNIHDRVTVDDLNTTNLISTGSSSKSITRRSTQAMAVPMDNDLIGTTILSNIYNTSNTLNTIKNLRRIVDNKVPLKSSKTSNDPKFDRQKVFRFYLPTNELSLADHHAMFASVLPSTRMSPSLVYIPNTKVSANDINSAVAEQLSTFPTISDTTVLDCKQYTHSDTSGKYLVPARTLSMGELYDMPSCSVISDAVQYIASRGSNDSARQRASKAFIKPADTKTKTKNTMDNDMLKLRRDALKKVHCSISTEDAATSQKMREEMVSQFDFDGEKINHNLYHNSSEDRRLLFNSSFFRINNSTMENGFKKRADELAPQGIKPEEMVHGTGYGNAVGILGRSGGWMLNGKNQTSGSMLGNGAYFGRSAGKSIVYVSSTDNSYSCLRHNGNQGDNANGIIIQASVLRDPGHYKEDGPGSSSRYHGIKAYEAVINSNNDILPHHIVAVSGRDLKAGNVTRDSKGNYVDPDTGQVLWDRTGMRVDNKTTGSHTK